METLPVTISPSELIEFLSLQLNNLPDKRKGSNTTYKIREFVVAAFSVFFTQCPSFLEHQNLMKKNRVKDNANSLFGLNKIPCDNQIRTILDTIPATKVFPTFQTVWEWLRENKIMNHFKYLDEEILLALDGTEYYSSKNINCPHCNCRNHRNGTTTYYHQVMTPVIVAPEKKQVINLEPEFIRKQDGKTKQDCENAAIKRWLLRNPAKEKNQKITLLGDDLLYYRYKYANNVPLRETSPSLMVNWYEVEIYDKAKKKEIYEYKLTRSYKFRVVGKKIE